MTNQPTNSQANWLERQLDKAVADVQAWPDWLKKEAGLTNPQEQLEARLSAGHAAYWLIKALIPFVDGIHQSQALKWVRQFEELGPFPEVYPQELRSMNRDRVTFLDFRHHLKYESKLNGIGIERQGDLIIVTLEVMAESEGRKET